MEAKSLSFSGDYAGCANLGMRPCRRTAWMAGTSPAMTAAISELDKSHFFVSPFPLRKIEAVIL
jgi:hypothetical protein